jgi:hypothetical protein
VNVLKTWLRRNHCYDLEDEEAMEKINHLIATIRKGGLTKEADMLQNHVENIVVVLLATSFTH